LVPNTEHKKPLIAFAVVLMAAAVVVGNGLRADALSDYLGIFRVPVGVFAGDPPATAPAGSVNSPPGRSARPDRPLVAADPAPHTAGAARQAPHGKHTAPARAVAPATVTETRSAVDMHGTQQPAAQRHRTAGPSTSVPGTVHKVVDRLPASNESYRGITPLARQVGGLLASLVELPTSPASPASDARPNGLGLDGGGNGVLGLETLVPNSSGLDVLAPNGLGLDGSNAEAGASDGNEP
jgi:hypothetical protein